VTMPGYSFTGLPDPLDAGVHSFELTDDGNEPHVITQGMTHQFVVE